MRELRAGAEVAGLRVEGRLGQGGFGVVYLARDPLIQRVVALKAIQPPLGAETSAALQEAQIVGNLNSPHVVTLYRVHPHDDGGYLLEMEYVDGGSLDDQLDQPWPEEQARRTFAGIVSGLHAAHEAGVVHGDVKPANVLLGTDGSVKLADFGLARILGETTLAADLGGQPIGTPLYMAPEVIMGERAAPASDLWSAGVILYRMLAARMPFDDRDWHSLFLAVQNAAPAPFGRHVPPDLARLALRCLAKRSEDRPGGAELLERLSRSPLSVSTGPAPAFAHDASRIVGRRDELAVAGRLIEATAQGGLGTLFVAGPTGVGKSALLEEVAMSAGQRGFLWLKVDTSEITGLFRRVVEACRPHVGATDLLERASAEIGSRQELAYLAERLLLELARERPVGLVIEDVHLADREDILFLRSLLPRLRGVFVAMTCREDELAAENAEQLAQCNTERITLGPLAPEAVYRLIETRTGLRAAPELARLVVAKSEGNALFAVELLRHLEETRAIERAEGELRPGPAWKEAVVPARFRELAARRLRSLSEEDRELLEVAAVDGLHFDGEAVAAVLDVAPLKVLRRLQRLYREHGLIRPQETGFDFAHGLIREALYADVAPELRRALHQQLAEHLEARAVPAAPERLALHWEQAGDAARAAPHFLAAATEAARRQEWLRTIDLARRGGLGPETIDAELAYGRSELVRKLAAAFQGCGRSEEARILDRALLAGATAHGEELLGHAMVAIRRFTQEGMDGIDEAKLRAAAERLAPSRYLVDARFVLGLVARHRQELDEAREWFARAEEVAVEVGLEGHRGRARYNRGLIALNAGRYEEAEAEFLESARVYRTLGWRLEAAQAEINAALGAYGSGHLDGVAGRVEGGISVLDLEGIVASAAHARVLLGEIQYAAGDLTAAVQSTRAGLEALRRTGYLPGLTSALSQWADFMIVSGELGEAMRVLTEAGDIATASGSLLPRAHVELLRMKLSCCLGDLSAGQAAAQRALELARGKTSSTLPLAVASALGQCVLYGLPVETLNEAERLIEASDVPEAETRTAAVMIQAGRAWREGRAQPLRAAARALQGLPSAQERAFRLVLAGWLVAAAHQAEHRAQDAEHEARGALGAAHRLGHVWLETGLLRDLSRWKPGSDYEAKLRRNLRRLARQLDSADERTRLLESWNG